MTDKELKKLSRLELLELLLQVSQENETLKTELEKQKSENSLAKTAGLILDTAAQIEASLQNSTNLVFLLEKIVSATNTEEGRMSPADKNEGCNNSDTENNIAESKNPDTADNTEGSKNDTDNNNDESAINTERIPSKKGSVDVDIYKRLMLFFNRNTDILSSLPDDLHTDIVNRLEEILIRK